MGLSVTIEANLTATEFLDVWFDLKNSTYRPFMKENSQPIYIDTGSNHPQTIKKQLPRMVNDRLSNLSSSKDKFVEHIHPYQEALKTAGYKEKLEYIENKTTNKKKRVRSRQVIWFNPPYSQSVKTNIGAQFLGLISKHFEKNRTQKIL
jgi:hypothetical protein